jgi:hypothetical protein
MAQPSAMSFHLWQAKHKMVELLHSSPNLSKGLQTMNKLGANQQPCWLYQAGTDIEKEVLRSQGTVQHITSGVLREAHNTVATTNRSFQILDDSYTFAKDYLERVKEANPGSEESLIDDFKQRAKRCAASVAQGCAKLAGKAVSNPFIPTALSCIFIGSILFDQSIKWEGFYKSDDLKALGHFYRELLELDSLVKTQPELFETPLESVQTASWHFDDTVETFGQGTTGMLIGQALKYAGVFGNTMQTIAAEQEISLTTQKAFGFPATDPALAVIKQIAIDTDRLRTVFVSGRSAKHYLGEDGVEKYGDSRSLYKEALTHELLCIIGRDNQVSKEIAHNERSGKGEVLNVSTLPHPIRDRMIQFIGTAMYGENVTQFDWGELESEVNQQANKFFADDKQAVANIKRRHENKESALEPAVINKDEMYRQLYDVRRMLGDEMERGLQLKQALDENTQPAL